MPGGGVSFKRAQFGRTNHARLVQSLDLGDAGPETGLWDVQYALVSTLEGLEG